MQFQNQRSFSIKVCSFVMSYVLCGAAFAVTPANKVVYEHATQLKPEFVNLLERLVNIDSGTGNKKGVDQIGAMVADELKKLGASVEFVSAAPAIGDNLVATLRGTGKAKIFLMAHLDTVFADGSAAARPFRIQGDRAYGPGVVDDKGGILMALFSMKILQLMKFRDFAQVTFLVNTNEETFSKGSEGLIKSLAKQHDVVLSMEGGRPADGVVVWRKGAADLLIDVKGKSAHTGIAPESGRNAALEAASQMLQMANLGDSTKLTSVNFTVIKSGDRVNTIPNSATVQGDMRAALPEEFDRVEKEMARLSERKLIAGTEVKTSLTLGMPPMPINPATESLAAHAQAIYSELGLSLKKEGSGGAGDANFTASTGTATIDGLGIVGGNFHTEDEYAELNSIVPRLYLLTRMVMDLSAKNR